jgi:hypothetical protein
MCRELDMRSCPTHPIQNIKFEPNALFATRCVQHAEVLCVNSKKFHNIVTPMQQQT